MSREKKSTGLPKGIRQLANGRYEARAQVNKKSINLYGKDLNALIQEFEDEKEKARTGSQYAMRNFTLNEWFELWFRDVKSKKLKAPSVPVIRNAHKRYYAIRYSRCIECNGSKWGFNQYNEYSTWTSSRMLRFRYRKSSGKDKSMFSRRSSVGVQADKRGNRAYAKRTGCFS